MNSMVVFGRSMIQLMWVQICAGSKMNVRPLRPVSAPVAKHKPLVIDWQANYERAMAGRSADIPRGSEESSIPLVPVQEAVKPKQMVTTREAAEAVGVSVQTIGSWARWGLISSHKEGKRLFVGLEEAKKCNDRMRAKEAKRGGKNPAAKYTVKAIHHSNRGGRWCPMGEFKTYAEAEEHMKLLAADDPTHAYTFEVVQMR